MFIVKKILDIFELKNCEEATPCELIDVVYLYKPKINEEIKERN